MGNVIGQGISGSDCSVKEHRVKKFDELTQEQQIQEMRQIIRTLHLRMERMSQVENIAKNHNHSNIGQVVVPVNSGGLIGSSSNYMPLE